MAMVAGTVTVTDAGVVTSSGLAGARFSALSTYTIGLIPTSTLAETCTLSSGANGTVKTNVLQNLAGQINVLAAADVTYIQANATANISTSLGGLQTSTGSGSATNPPSVAHSIPIT